MYIKCEVGMPHYLPGTEQCHLLYYLCSRLMYIKCEVGMPHYLPGFTWEVYKCEVGMSHYLPGFTWGGL